MAYKYRGKYPKRVAHVSFSKARGWRVRLNDGTIHNPPSRAVVAAFPIDGIKHGMEWADVEAAMHSAVATMTAQAPRATIYKALLVAGMLGGAAMIGTMVKASATQGASDTFSINDSIGTDCHLVTITTMDNRDTLANALALASDTIRKTGCVNIEVQQ